MATHQSTAAYPSPPSEPANMEEGLFSSSIIPKAASDKLPEGYRLRALRRSDYDTGFLDCLRVLTTVGDVTREQFKEQYDAMDEQEGYYIIVVEDPSRKEKPVVATGALIIERKLYVIMSSSVEILLTCAAFTRSERSATSKTSPSPRTSRARSSDCASSRRSTASRSTSGVISVFWTAATRTRGFTSSAAFDEPACRWRIITRPRGNKAGKLAHCLDIWVCIGIGIGYKL